MLPLVKTFAQLAAPASLAALACRFVRNHTFEFKVASIGTNVTVRADGSALTSGTDWAPLGLVDEENVVANCACASGVLTVDANGTYLLRVTGVSLARIRFTWISESTGTPVMDVRYIGDRP